jgi:hypothetical protein
VICHLRQNFNAGQLAADLFDQPGEQVRHRGVEDDQDRRADNDDDQNLQ